MNKNDLNYISKVISDAVKNNISIKLLSKSIIKDGNSRYYGIFDETERVLEIATKTSFKSWFPVFVHESCHMYQFIEKCKVWRDSIEGDKDYYSLFLQWIDKEIELSKRELLKASKKSLLIELDCEKRVVNKIREYNLSIDENLYIKKSNFYLFCFSAVKSNRKWYEEINAKYHEQIIKIMPNKFCKSYENPPFNYEKLPLSKSSIDE